MYLYYIYIIVLSSKKDGRKNLLLIDNDSQRLRKPSENRVLHLEYLYASPLDLASLDVRAEIEALATIPGVNLTVLVLGLVERAWKMRRWKGGRGEVEQEENKREGEATKGEKNISCEVPTQM